jgi:predicted RNA-binding Zn-ribbon protein involved in translation (DUF1610 family)
MTLRCNLCFREIDSSIENILFYCNNCHPPKIYCSTCEREKLPRKGLIKKVLCTSCQKPVKLVKDLKKLPKELQNLPSEEMPILEVAPESAPAAVPEQVGNPMQVESAEFVTSYGKFCASCGSQLIEGAQWCPECGEKVQ